MKILNISLVFMGINSLFAEDLGNVNLSYQKTNIKMKAKQATSNSGICYKYVEIKNTKEWNLKKDKLIITYRIIKIDVENFIYMISCDL